MAKVYDVCRVVFGDIKHNYPVEILELGDSIEIKTDVVIDGVNRGWIGDITFNFDGYDLDDHNTVGRNAHEPSVLSDVLCCRRTFDSNDGNMISWTYTFLKY